MPGFFGIPTPGEVVSGIGNFMRGAEQFVSDGLNNAVDAAQEHSRSDNDAERVVIRDPARGTTGEIQGIVGRAEFDAYKGHVANLVKLIRDEIARVSVQTIQGSSGSSSGMNPLVMLLLLEQQSGSSTLDTETLLLLMMAQGGGGIGGQNGGIDATTMLLLMQ